MTSRAGRTSSADLVPQGLPQGQRQVQQQLRSEAGVPVASRDVQAAPPLAGQVERVGNLRPENVVRPARHDLDVLMDFTPDQLPGFAQPTAERPLTTRGAPPQALADRMDQMAQASNNRFVAAVAQRMRVNAQRQA